MDKNNYGMNYDLCSMATAAIEARLDFSDKAESTLIFDTPLGGGNHRGTLVAGLILASGCGFERSRSAIYLSTKLCVDNGLLEDVFIDSFPLCVPQRPQSHPRSS